MEVRKTFEIPKVNIKLLKKEFNKLNRRAKKVGMSAPTFEILAEIQKEYRNEFDKKVKVDCYMVEIVGETPKFEGWTFISTLDHRNDGTTLIQNVPGESIPEHYRETGCACEHCGVNRFRRKTFIVRHDDGRHMQVGSTCIKDFLGGKTPEQIAKIAEWWGIMEGFGGGWDGIPRDEFYYNMMDVLSSTAAIINDTGWLPRSRSEEGAATADIVTTWFVNPSKFNEFYGKNMTVEDKDIEIARNAIEWCLNLENKDKLNDYEYNIVTLAKSDNIRIRDFGLACSIVASYVNHLNREIENKEKNLDKSEHVGEIKKRYEFDNAEVIFVKEINGAYGLTTLIKFKTEDDNILTWFATNAPSVERGEKYNIRATVKKHDEYNGIKQTLVNRVFFKKEKK